MIHGDYKASEVTLLRNRVADLLIQRDKLLSKLEAAVEEANAINRHDSATVAQTLGELTGKIQAIIWAATDTHSKLHD